MRGRMASKATKVSATKVSVPAQAFVGKFIQTFKDYPQRQKAASFNMDEVFAKMKESGGH